MVPISLLAAVTLAFRTASAAEFFVSLFGDDNASGTRETPFRTLARAAAMMAAGDSCHVQPGLYEEPLIPPTSGKAGAPHRFLGDGPGVVIRPAAEGPDGGDPRALLLTSRAYLEISNLVFLGRAEISGRACSIVQCVFRHAPRPEPVRSHRRAAVSVSGVDHLIEKCLVEDWPGIGLELLTNSARIRVAGCLLDGCGWAAPRQPALFASGSAHVLEANTIANSRHAAMECDELWNARVQRNDLHSSGREADGGAALTLRGNGKGSMIRRNWIHDGHGPKWDAVAFGDGAMNWLFHRNIVWNHQGAAVRFLGAAQSCLIFNNSFWNNGAGLVWSSSSSSAQAMQVFNNILCKSGTVPAELATARHNFIGNQPGWRNPDALDFRLEEDSPCRNVGEPPPDTDDPSAADLGAMPWSEDDWLAGCEEAGWPPPAAP